MVTIRGLFRTQISKMIYFLKRLNSFQQKAPSQMFQRFWICLWYRSLKYCNFKTSNIPPPEKRKKKLLYIFYILNKIILTAENMSTVLHNLFLLDMSIFNDLVITNDPVKKAKYFFVLMEEVQLHNEQVLVLEHRTFHCIVLSRQQIYCFSKL